MVSFMKKQVLIFNSVVNFMLSFKIRCNIQFLQAKCNSYWVQKVSLCRYFFLLFQGSTKPPAHAIEIEVFHGNSDFFPAQNKQMLKEPPISIFFSVFVVWNRYHSVYPAEPNSASWSLPKLPRLWLSSLVAPEHIGRTWLFLSKQLSILRAMNWGH